MKFNWGTGIAIFYSVFVVVMVGMVIYSRGVDHSLVMDNYYEEDLKYQSHIDAVKNTRTLGQDLVIRFSKEEKSVQLDFPEEFSELKGSIWFYRADNKSLDFKINIQPGEGRHITVPTPDLVPGRWTIKVNWEGDGRPFYKEESVVL